MQGSVATLSELGKSLLMRDLGGTIQQYVNALQDSMWLESLQSEKIITEGEAYFQNQKLQDRESFVLNWLNDNTGKTGMSASDLENLPPLKDIFRETAASGLFSHFQEFVAPSYAKLREIQPITEFCPSEDNKVYFGRPQAVSTPFGPATVRSVADSMGEPFQCSEYKGLRSPNTDAEEDTVNDPFALTSGGQRESDLIPEWVVQAAFKTTGGKLPQSFWECFAMHIEFDSMAGLDENAGEFIVSCKPLGDRRWFVKRDRLTIHDVIHFKHRITNYTGKLSFKNLREIIDTQGWTQRKSSVNHSFIPPIQCSEQDILSEDGRYFKLHEHRFFNNVFDNRNVWLGELTLMHGLAKRVWD
ncbi:hypothetical protein QFC22_005837 [Naganishia vaughanmartiniae]|uniref:Uncharacterized protein n=1 Tax=Naganishia vaughanmartiniae TaxID=1424756 RepID=A0ACC2WU13_9TREE|nr:hypothetical protein QFC22_005837 [Naganishia vaughanmartiniae]